MSDSALEIRRAAVTRLGAALRAATVGVVSTEVPVEELERATVLAQQIADIVGADVRPATRQASVDDTAHGIRHFGPVTGVGSPLAPPLAFERTRGGVGSHVTLDRRFEGPPGFVHGGIAGLLLDEILGQAATQVGRWGMTASLTISYSRPLPLDVELFVEARVTRTERRKTWVSGRIVVASEPEARCVEAEALFVTPREETHEAYFDGFTDAAGEAAQAGYGAARLA